MARLKMESASGSGSGNVSAANGTAATALSIPTSTVLTSGGVGVVGGHVSVASLQLNPIDCYEDMFKEITKKLYGEEAMTEVIDTTGNHQSIVYETDGFRTDGGNLTAAPGLTLVNGLPPGTILVQRRITDDKGRIWALDGSAESVALATVAAATSTAPVATTVMASPTTVPAAATVTQTVEERWFESDEVLQWTASKVARYNPSQKVFRCVDCDFVGFLSRVAEHWLGNHASLRVFQCPRCPYTSAWARCVRMHLTRQHGETLTDNSLWKENPVLEEVTKFLNNLKTRVEQKGESAVPGEKRYTCPYCPYATDRRDLFNRHENIHREEKPFQCYVCEKQFNRADHVKKHFMRMHREHAYDINRIRKQASRSQGGGALPYYKSAAVKGATTAGQQQQQHQQPVTQVQTVDVEEVLMPHSQQQTATVATAITAGEPMTVQLAGTNQTVTLQQIPHIAYFNPPATANQTGPLQGIAGVGGIKKESKGKTGKKKKSGDKMYTCSYCPWQGVDNWCLKRHLNTHIKPFLCALCDYKAARSERLATHVLKVHNKRVCHKCSFLADDLDSLNTHIQESHQNPLVKTGYNCNVCQEYFELRADLEAHAILEHQKVIVQCDLCDYRTTDELSMESHLRDKHNLQPGMGAVAAAAAAAAAAAINGSQAQSQMIPAQVPTLHIQEVISDVNSLQTSEPQQLMLTDSLGGQQVSVSMPEELSFVEVKEEEMEEIIEEEEPETRCSTCGIDFVDELSLRKHERRHELRPPEPFVLPKTSKQFLGAFQCSTCSYTCPTMKMMIQHMRAHNGNELKCRADGCNFSTPFDNTLKEHIHADHNSSLVRCPHCGVRVNDIKIFTLHWRVHHRTVCSLCVNVYKVKFGLKENDVHDLILRNPLEFLDDVYRSEAAVVPEATNCPQEPAADTATGEIQVSLPEVTETVTETDIGTENTATVDAVSETDTETVTVPAAVGDLNLECLDGISRKRPLDKSPLDTVDPVLIKKRRLEIILNYEKPHLWERESLRFLPRAGEVQVSPVTIIPAVKGMEKLRWKLRVINERRRQRRHLRLGSLMFAQLRPRRRGGFKCHHISCKHMTVRYHTKVAATLHFLYRHKYKRYKCPACDFVAPHLYIAYIHEMKAHPKGSSGKADNAPALCLDQAQGLLPVVGAPPQPSALPSQIISYKPETLTLAVSNAIAT